MEREFLEKYYKEGTRIKIVLDDKDVFTGVIKKLGDNNLILLDKFGEEVSLSLKTIDRALPFSERFSQRKYKTYGD